MPTLDTEVLFGLNPKDHRHRNVLNILKSLREGRRGIYAPDTAMLEFQAVLRSLDRQPSRIRAPILALRRAFQINKVTEARTIDSSLLTRQCEIEESYGLTYFDSLIAASTLSLDGELVSDDPAFDMVPGIRRIPISEK